MRIAAPLIAALLVGSLPALSQTTGATAVPGAAQGMTALSMGQMRAKDLMDRDVRSSDDANIGEVEDLVIDPASGRIVAAVIEVEGTLGIGGRYVAVPLDQLRMTAGERRVVVNMTREQLRNVPAFRYRD